MTYRWSFGRILPVLAVAALLLLPAPRAGRAAACSINWTSTSSGDWNTPANWDADRVPNASDDACIDPASALSVTVNQDAAAASLTIGDHAALRVECPGSASVHLQTTGTITNLGAIHLSAPGAACTLDFSGGGSPGIQNNATGSFVVDQGSAGSIQVTGSFLNQGSFTASSPVTFVPDSGATTFDNQGTFDVTATGHATFDDPDWSFNLGGTGWLDIESAGGFDLSGAFNYTSGLVSPNPPQITGTLNFLSASLSQPASFVLSGSSRLGTDVPSGATVDIQNSSASAATVQEDQTIINHGTLSLQSTAPSTMVSYATSDTAQLIIAPDGFLTLDDSGGGPLSFAGNLTNYGSVTVNGNVTFGSPQFSALIINNTDFLVTSGTASLGNGLVFFQLSGALDLAEPTSLVGTAITLDFNGGSTPHYPLMLNSSNVNFSGGLSQTPFELHLRGMNAFNENVIPPGVTVYVDGADAQSGIIASGTPNPLVNMGTLVFSSSGTSGSTQVQLAPGGALDNAGSIYVSGGNNAILGSVDNLPAGRVIQSGGLAVSAPFTNEGSYAFVASTAAFPKIALVSATAPTPNSLTVAANFTQPASGSLTIDIAGSPASALYGSLAIQGVASLDGSLNLVPAGGFQPKVGAVYTFIVYGSHTGAFAAARLTGRLPVVTYNPSSATFSAQPFFDMFPIIMKQP